MPAKNAFETMVIGSHPVPDWYATLEADVVAGRLAPESFADAKRTAATAAIADQEAAGIDVVSDGELFRRNDNRNGPPNAMINHFALKIPGFAKAFRPKSGITPVAPHASLPAPVVHGPLGPADLGLVEELRFLRARTKRPVKIAMASPYMFAMLAWDEHYKDVKALTAAMADVIAAEFGRLDAEGCDYLQIDEPILWFTKQNVEWVAPLIDRCFSRVRRATTVLHLCQGNYGPEPEAHVGLRIFPAKFADMIGVASAVKADVIAMAFASFHESDEAVASLARFPKGKRLAVGAVDVQNHGVETPEQVAAVLRRVAKHVPAERLLACPDCGLNHLPWRVATRKLAALVEGAALARQGAARAKRPTAKAKKAAAPRPKAKKRAAPRR
jgi:5-methyltetrahydropteroyltriglutamate--homocysteine methyltransferase